jgi:hypothetical protein
MPRRRVDRTGQRFDRLVAVRHDAEKPRNWIFRCNCGAEVSRCPSNLTQNTYNACRKCLSGAGASWVWAGVGKIPKDYYNTIQHSAAAKGLEFSVSLEYLWVLYVSQGGECAFTGWPIEFHTSYVDKPNKTASLDRINSNLGYIEGNLQWVHRDINKLKKNMSDKRFVELCLAVATHQGMI